MGLPLLLRFHKLHIHSRRRRDINHIHDCLLVLLHSPPTFFFIVLGLPLLSSEMMQWMGLPLLSLVLASLYFITPHLSHHHHQPIPTATPTLSETHLSHFFNMTQDVAEMPEIPDESTKKDYHEPPPAPLIDTKELTKWSFYRAVIAEFVATLLFLYVTVLTVIGYKSEVDKGSSPCGGVGILGIAWAFGAMIFILVYCTAGISGGHINPAVTFGLFLARKVSLPRAILYIAAQCLGAICGVAIVKGLNKTYYNNYGGGANQLADGYNEAAGLGAEIIGTFALVYTVFSATDPKRNARDSYVPALAPLPIGFAVFVVHLCTIPITGTGINPARSLGAAVIYNKKKAWDDQWIFWVGPLVGAAIAAFYHQFILRAGAAKALESFRSSTNL